MRADGAETGLVVADPVAAALDMAALDTSLATVSKRLGDVELWLENFNVGNLEAIQELLTADFKAVFGDVELTWKDTLEEAPKAFAAFPDFQLKCTECSKPSLPYS